jgi:hypothetical protein
MLRETTKRKLKVTTERADQGLLDIRECMFLLLEIGIGLGFTRNEPVNSD